MRLLTNKDRDQIAYTIERLRDDIKIAHDRNKTTRELLEMQQREHNRDVDSLQRKIMWAIVAAVAYSTAFTLIMLTVL